MSAFEDIETKSNSFLKTIFWWHKKHEGVWRACCDFYKVGKGQFKISRNLGPLSARWNISITKVKKQNANQNQQINMYQKTDTTANTESSIWMILQIHTNYSMLNVSLAICILVSCTALKTHRIQTRFHPPFLSRVCRLLLTAMYYVK